MRLTVPLVFGVVIVAGLVSTVMMFRTIAGRASTSRIENAPTGLSIPPFELVDQNGAPITEAVLVGEYTVVDFFFTSCPLYCPGMTAAMDRVADATEGVRFLSISIDGERDTPQVIREYAGSFGLDLDRWSFATGPRESVWPLLRDGLGFHVGDDPATQIRDASGVEMSMIQHPTRLMLVGPDRSVIGLYRYTDAEEINDLIAEANRLAG